MNIVQTTGLCKQYGQSMRVRGLNLSVPEGCIYGFLGPNGAGKSTTLKMILGLVHPTAGQISVFGKAVNQQNRLDILKQVGSLIESPSYYGHLTGEENLRIVQTLRDVPERDVRQVLEIVRLQNQKDKKVAHYSLGMKQRLGIAAALLGFPKLLILDEPTSQLDPIAAADFIATLRKLNNELGLTVLLVEHRLEEVFPIADKVLLMDKGRVLLYDTPRDVGRSLAASHPMQLGLPSAVRIFNALGQDGACPLTVREGRDFLERLLAPEPPAAGDDAPPPYVHDGEAALEMKNVFFRYERSLPDVLRGASLCVYKGEFYCLLGGNGTGKTTTLNVLAGLNRAYRGKVRVGGRPIGDYKGGTLYRGNLALLPQNPQTVFVRDRLRDDFAELLEAQGVKKEERDARIASVAEKIGVAALLDQHPYDLSGGEQQKCAIAKMLLLEPRILLMDEPTKGLDAHAKRVLRDILRALKADGITILMVTHDVAFAAENADRCALFFDGEVLSADVPERFFAENNFYTTAANRMARRFWKYAVTCEQVTARAREALRASEAAGARGEQA